MLAALNESLLSSMAMNAGTDNIPLQVIGAGPAGIGLVLALCNRIAAAGTDAELAAGLLNGLKMFEATNQPGGKMGRYRVNANTSSHDVVKGIGEATPFAGIRDDYMQHPGTQSELMPLSEIETLMVEPLAQVFGDFLGRRLHCNTEVRRIEIGAGGIESYDIDNQSLARSDNILLCCGAREVPLQTLLSYSDCWEGSGTFLMRDSLAGLTDNRQPIVIIGASHSAFSCAWRLLFDPLFDDFACDREIILLQRRKRIKLRCTREFAAANRIDYDPETDICPTTGLVFHNGGLRKDAKALYLRIRDGHESRVKMLPIDQLSEYQALLEQAGLILQATGFTTNFPVIEQDGVAINPGDPTQDGELHDLDSGKIIPGLMGMGLGLNILPEGEPRGEPSFDGGIHGFQSYPLSIAPRVIDRLMLTMPMELCN